MIVDNQSNLKVHFAGAEQEMSIRILYELSGVRYFLFTVFPLIAEQVGIKPMKMKDVSDRSAVRLNYSCRHAIMDSGLFTLMFGAHAGKRDAKFVETWYQLIVDYVHKVGYQGTVVEVDCQKILGVEAAWNFRRRMKHDMPNRQINVFHIEDGQRGLDEMIEFSDYIAISVPELRKLGKKNQTERLANYIKAKKPSIDIHLLGCTENKLLRDLNFCTSADSISWKQVNMYGWLKTNHGNGTKEIQSKKISSERLRARYSPRLEEILRTMYEVTPQRFDYYAKLALAGETCLHQYTYYAGDQS